MLAVLRRRTLLLTGQKVGTRVALTLQPQPPDPDALSHCQPYRARTSAISVRARGHTLRLTARTHTYPIRLGRLFMWQSVADNNIGAESQHETTHDMLHRRRRQPNNSLLIHVLLWTDLSSVPECRRASPSLASLATRDNRNGNDYLMCVCVRVTSPNSTADASNDGAAGKERPSHQSTAAAR